ncbi:putative ABC1 family protein lscO [[Candida] jaroonii]|uniref:ABC1 family protein lscO n=1 Tax=[Candida] jaroonii TaxID=467808 RepID=A0ACA9Y490_9ASCO|nr:putative ABC1 family protein lscO [[Candida] jaroonii]
MNRSFPSFRVVRSSWKSYSTAAKPPPTTPITPKQPPTAKTPGFKGKKLLILGLGLGAVYEIDNIFYSSTLTRSIRAVTVLTYVALRYKYTSSENQSKLHEPASEMLFNMFTANKGLYIKFGQAIANQGSVFPVAYQKKLVRLYDEAPCDDWNTVDGLLKKELGRDYETELFQTLDHKPIASASIAQVHKGVLKNGDVVAVKVQHHYIQTQVAADLFVYRMMVKVYEKAFDLPMAFYSKYISDQTMTETRFTNELANTEYLRQCIENDSSVRKLGIYIPKTYNQWNTDKVLIMEWVDGVSLVDKTRLIGENYDLTTIMHQFVTIFAKQVFKYGFVHSDPHPGNLLVRKIGGKQQLVILDHGLYVKFTEEFRKEYCQLWEYMFSFNTKGLNDLGQKWGIKYMNMFGSMSQLKPVDLSEEEKQLFQKNMMVELFSDLTKFPLDIVFLSRAMRIVQNTNKQLGSPVNRINYLTNEALNSLVHDSSFTHWFTLITLKTSLLVSSMVFWFYRLSQIWKGDKYGYKSMGYEDNLDEFMKDRAKDMGMEIVDDPIEIK